MNLERETGFVLFLELLASADILVENFRAKVKYRLKIDFERLRHSHPRLIFASISGFVQDGPPIRVAIAISDTFSGMFLGQGIPLALIERAKTGKGQWVHTSLLEAMLSKPDFQAARYTMSGNLPGRVGNDHATFSPMGVFKAADGLVDIAAITTKMFRAFCEVLSQPQLAKAPRFETGPDRLAHR